MFSKKSGIIIRNILFIVGIALVVLAFSLWIYAYISAQHEEYTDNELLVPSDPQYKVLFLDSYTPIHTSYEDQEAGLKAGLYPNNLSYDVIYMDTKNYGSEEQINDFYKFFKKRMEDSIRNYSALIVGDDAALVFALKYQDEFFKNMPIVFYGINNIELAEKAAKLKNITGFSEETYLDETFDLAIKLQSKAKQIVCIYDDTITGEGDRETFYSYEKDYPDYKFVGINTSKYSRVEFGNKLEKLGKESILLYMTAFNDKNGNSYTIYESSKFISEHSNIPVYRNYPGGDNNGIMGGTRMDFFIQCKFVGKTISEVLLDNKDIDEIPLNNDTPGKSVYDYKILKKYDINLKKLPKNTILLNEPKNFIEEYGELIKPLIIFFVGMLLIMISLILNYYLLKSSNEKLYKAESKLKYDSEHDALTGMLNRHAVEKILIEKISKHDITGIMRVDIDNFKALNEIYGHIVGDEYLRYVSKLLENYSDEHNFTIARYSGDEFIIIIPDKCLSEYSQETKDIHHIFHRSMTVGMEQVKTTVSMGIVNADRDMDVEMIFVNADIALNSAKAQGKNTTIVFTGDELEKITKINQTRNKVINAIENEEFYMLYQPKVDTKTKELVGYEALIRMRNESMSPGIFIPIAEQSGLISQIGRMTTEMTIRQLAEWKEKGLKLKPVSINYSSNQINDSEYVDFIKDLLDKYDIDSKYIEIEITEGLFMDSTWQAEKLFNQFKELGIKILMDDFGTGYSSLSYLTYIPVDILKLDRTFVNNYLVDGKDSFIKDVILLSHDLGKKMVIEGVEEKWQYERLKEYGADVIQGYYFSKPIPAEDAIQWVATV